MILHDLRSPREAWSRKRCSASPRWPRSRWASAQIRRSSQWSTACCCARSRTVTRPGWSCSGVTGRAGKTWLSEPELDDYRGQAGALDALAGFAVDELNLAGAGEPTRVRAARTQATIFAALGATPMLGRTYMADEDRPGARRVAIVSEGLWRAQFGADPAIVGRLVRLEASLTRSSAFSATRSGFPPITSRGCEPTCGCRSHSGSRTRPTATTMGCSPSLASRLERRSNTRRPRSIRSQGVSSTGGRRCKSLTSE